MARRARISTRDWKNRPPRTAAGAVTLQRRPRACAPTVCVVPCPKTSSRPSTAIAAKIVITARRAHSPTVAPRGSGAAATSVNRLVTRTRFGGARKPSCVVAHSPCPPHRSTSRPTSTTTCSARPLGSSSCGAPRARTRASELGAFLVRAGHGDRGRPRHAPGDHGASSASSPIAPRSRPAGPAEKLGRLKPNAQLRGYSPLSPLVELEGLLVGSRASSRCGGRWPRSPRTLGLDRARLEGLAARAEASRPTSSAIASTSPARR